MQIGRLFTQENDRPCGGRFCFFAIPKACKKLQKNVDFIGKRVIIEVEKKERLGSDGMKKILALMLCVVFALALTSCGKDDSKKSADGGKKETAAGMSHSEFEAAALDAAVTVETYVQAKQSWREGKATFYTQSPDGAYFLYQMPCTGEEYAALTTGTKIKVSGKKSEWKGETEITDASFEIGEGNYVAEPVDVTPLLHTGELIAHQNELVRFKGMTVEAKTDSDGKVTAFLYNWDGTGKEGDDLYFDVSLDGNKYTFTVESDLCGPDTDVYKAVKELKVGDVIDLTGFLYWYEGANPHITEITPA